jgi:hypothetical protein
MKHLKIIFLLVLFIAWNCFMGLTAKPGKAKSELFAFTHPGMLNSNAELDMIKAKIKAGDEPWKTAFNKMKSSNFGSLTWEPMPIAVVQANWTPTRDDAGTENNDATAAYTQALLWYFTDNEAYAKKTVEILNAWSLILTSHTSSDLQKQLVAGWCGSLFPLAAEIIRASYPKWTTEEIARFSSMLSKAFLPLLIDGNPTYNGNWEMSMINAMMCIGVFNEDQATFDKAIFLWRKRVPAYFYLITDGNSPIRPYGTSNLNSESAIKSYWFNPTQYFDGLCQETCRDYGHHAQMGLASAINSAEIAYHQGIDLYSENEQRIMAAMEFQAGPILGNPVSKVLFPNGFVSSDMKPTWEIAYNHFHNRKGYTLPKTDTLIRTKVRPSYFTTMLNIAWESLTHAELDVSTGTFDLNQNANSTNCSLKIAPNPVNSVFILKYKVITLSAIEFVLYDMSGNLVEIQRNVKIKNHSGEYNWQPKSKLAPGIYCVSIQQNGKKLAECKLVKN